MIEYKPLTENNFQDFIRLIQLRGGANEVFYKWKYLENPIQIFPLGYIAYIDGKPCGCMGCISRIYIDLIGQEHPATWFADWFVDPAFRGNHVGMDLQKKIFSLSTFAYGITNPQPAQIIAKKTGYTNHPNCILSQGLLKAVLRKNVKPVNIIKQYIKDLYNVWSVRPFRRIKINSNQVLSGEEIVRFINNQPIPGSFLKDARYYEWILLMPTDTQRKWFVCSVLNIKMLICVERVCPESVKMKVYQSSFSPNGNKQYYHYLRILASVASTFNAICFETFDIITGVKKSFRFSTIGHIQPMQYSIMAGNGTLNQVSIADKESSWTNVNIKQ